MQTIALDVHAHLIPARDGRLDGFAGVSWDAGTEKLTVDGHGIGLKNLFRPEALTLWMADNAVAHAWISAPPPVYRPELGPDETRRWSEALNAGLQAIAAAHADRLSALFHLPVEHPAVAVEIARDRIARGHSRFAMPAGGAGVMLSDPVFAPLWQVLDEASAFLFLHPGESCDARLDPFYLANLLGNPTETAIASAHLVFGGILERHPRLTVCLAHAGGTTAALAGRFERGYATDRPGLDQGLEPPRRTLRRLCVDCIAHDRAGLALAAEVFGADRILFGSDWPFPMGLPKPHEQMAGIEPGFRRAIFCDNAGTVLGEG
ncbi:amidohydrolase family protein [Phreatobacter stygius]|nr:amidohydrolase family protein [Phreatobacter stygius]